MESARKQNPRGSLPRQSNVQPRTSTLAGSRSQDPRDITSKPFQSSAIRKILEYLETHNFEAMLTTKHLQTPTAKDFTRVLEFLMRQIDPLFEITGKLDVEIPELFKQLGYPFIITKNALVAIGAPNTWPSLLAALDWLVDLLTYTENILAAPAPEEDADEQSMIAEKMLKAYGLFLANQDFSEELQDLKNQLKEKVDSLALQIDHMKQALTAGKAEKEALKQSLVNPKLLDSQIACLEQEVRTLSNVDILLQKKKTLEGKLVFVRDELDIAQAQYKTLDQSIQATKEKIDHQEFTQEGLQRLEKQIEALESQRETMRKDREEADQVTWDLEQKLKESQAQIATSVREFNLMCAEFKLVPSTAKHAVGIDFALACGDREDEPVSNIASLSKLPEVVKDMRAKVDAKIERKEKELVATEQDLHTKQQLHSELDQQEKALQDAVRQASSTSTLGIAAIMEQIEKRSRDIADLDKEIKAMKDSELALYAQIAEMQDKQDSLQLSLDHQMQQWANQISECEALVRTDAESVRQHYAESQDFINEIVEYSRSRLD